MAARDLLPSPRGFANPGISDNVHSRQLEPFFSTQGSARRRAKYPLPKKSIREGATCLRPCQNVACHMLVCQLTCGIAAALCWRSCTLALTLCKFLLSCRRHCTCYCFLCKINASAIRHDMRAASLQLCTRSCARVRVCVCYKWLRGSARWEMRLKPTPLPAVQSFTNLNKSVDLNP